MTGPYKRDGETVYATGAIQESSEGESDTPDYKDKEWLHFQYHVLGRSQREIADLSDVAPSTISRNMKRFDISRRDLDRAMSKAMGGHELLWDEDWLRDQYISKEKSSTEIAQTTDTNKSTVLDALDRCGIPKRGRSDATALTHSKGSTGYGDEKYNNESWLEWQYTQRQKTMREIAEENGWGVKTVHDALNRHDIPTRSNKAAQLLRWKGGKGEQPQNQRPLVHSGGIDASWRDLSDIKRGKYVQYRDPTWLQARVNEGLSLREIADAANCDVSNKTISRWINRLDITPSSGGDEKADD